MQAGNKTILWADLTNSGDGNPPPDVKQHFAVQQVLCSQQIDSAIRNLRPCAVCLELDYDHPASDELAALIRIRSSYPALPVVVISARYSLVLAMYVLREKVQGYIVKQYSDSMADMLDEVIRRSRAAATRTVIWSNSASVRPDRSG